MDYRKHFEKACECSCIGFTFTVNIHKIIQYQIKSVKRGLAVVQTMIYNIQATNMQSPDGLLFLQENYL